MVKSGEKWEKWGKVAKSGLEKVGEKWGKVVKSWRKVGWKSG